MKILLKNITRKYGKKVVIDNLSWSIDLEKENIIALIGSNGAGKTTLLKIISGIYTFESGNISTSEGEEDYFSWARDNISFLQSGDRGLRYRNSVYDNVKYYGAIKGINPNKTEELYEKYNKFLSMEEFRDRKIGDLSTGEKKKAALLCALCSGNKILILDEPSDGLDISAKIELQKIIKEISISQETKFIISTHDIEFISNIADTYAFIKNGNIKYENISSMDIEEIRSKFLEVNSL